MIAESLPASTIVDNDVSPLRRALISLDRDLSAVPPSATVADLDEGLRAHVQMAIDGFLDVYPHLARQSGTLCDAELIDALLAKSQACALAALAHPEAAA